MAVQLDEGHAIFLGPARASSSPAAARAPGQVRGGEFEVLEFCVRARLRAGRARTSTTTHVDSFYVLEGEVEFTIGDETYARTARHLGRGAGRTFATAFAIPGPGARAFPEHPRPLEVDSSSRMPKGLTA